VIRFARRFISLTFLVALLVAAAPGISHAGAKTLARSVQNLLFFPFDLALSPFVATKITYEKWRESSDTKAVKYGYALFAPIWNCGVVAGASVIRGVAGMIELLPGIALLPFDGEMSAIYDLPETQPAWVDVGAEAPFRMKFGVDYLSASSE
jgi:hypothetical protein